MKVVLTFDVEIWCNDWNNLDALFPASYERYVYGRSEHGQYALPKTLEILARHGLKGVFFVEPLFSARFGAEYLERLVKLIRDAGQEVQLHLHSEWVDEIAPSLLPGCAGKRQHLIHYSVDEQTTLIGHARALLEAAGSGPLSVFRAGNHAANRDTFIALNRNGIGLDSSLNVCVDVSGEDLHVERKLSSSFNIEGVATYPVSAFLDRSGRLRPAQVGACSASELSEALWSARGLGWQQFVVLSHNFEMMKVNSALPDRIVENRFERLCSLLAQHRDELPVGGFDALDLPAPDSAANSHESPWPQVSFGATLRRYAEQALRRLP